MGITLPASWRSRVRAILDSGDRKKIIVRQRALRDWLILFPDLFPGDLPNALSEALEDPELEGVQVFGMQEPGEIYEFIFSHANRRVYTKINLCPDGTVVIIYSAHRPLKGDTL
ncbi:MAG: hypothetical protein KGS61_14355 [Verrucomicrobia bacterium]|nr:hypothetical protein [Verrucomicrobiota bacterium]